MKARPMYRPDATGDHDRAHERIMATLRAWHNETHPGAFITCGDEPCREVRRIAPESVRHS